MKKTTLYDTFYNLLSSFEDKDDLNYICEKYLNFEDYKNESLEVIIDKLFYSLTKEEVLQIIKDNDNNEVDNEETKENFISFNQEISKGVYLSISSNGLITIQENSLNKKDIAKIFKKDISKNPLCDYQFSVNELDTFKYLKKIKSAFSQKKKNSSLKM